MNESKKYKNIEEYVTIFLAYLFLLSRKWYNFKLVNKIPWCGQGRTRVCEWMRARNIAYTLFLVHLPARGCQITSMLNCNCYVCTPLM